MTAEDFEAAKRSSQSWYWWGIPTFFRCPWVEDPAAADIALVGVPHSSGNGSTERDQHLGPRAVRHQSGFHRRSHVVHGFAPWDVARINDLGDVPLPEAMNNEACVRDIEAFYARLDQAGTRPVSIGGDHAITGPIIKALAGPGRKTTGGKPAALIHFDAHTDSYDNMPHWLGAKRSAAHWAAYTQGGCDRSAAQHPDWHARAPVWQHSQGRSRRIEPRSRLPRRDDAGIRRPRYCAHRRDNP